MHSESVFAPSTPPQVEAVPPRRVLGRQLIHNARSECRPCLTSPHFVGPNAFAQAFCCSTTLISFQTFRDFEDGTLVTSLGYDIVLQRRSIGKLSLPSGRLVACDPLSHPDTEAFIQTLAPGRYPVVLIVAELRDESRIAYAVIEVGAEPAVQWELGEVEGERDDTDDPLSAIRNQGQASGYRVESTIGAFMDVRAADAWIHYTQAVLPDDDEMTKELRGQFRRRRSKNHRYGWVNMHHPYLLNANIVGFESGFGEGIYPTYFGFRDDGVLTRVVSDFNVLDFRFPSFSPIRHDDRAWDIDQL